MKTTILLIVIAAFLFNSCAPGVPTQETKVTTSTPTRVVPTDVTMSPTLVLTEEPTATETATIVPSPAPPSCLALLTPVDGEEFEATGRVTFSWSPVKETIFYALNIMSPSGETVSFETKEPVRALYLEALPAGGTYQWNVIAEDRKRQEICSSEPATFSKPSYEPPKQPETNKKKKK
jgi:hypothetical protein